MTSKVNGGNTIYNFPPRRTKSQLRTLSIKTQSNNLQNIQVVKNEKERNTKCKRYPGRNRRQRVLRVKITSTGASLFTILFWRYHSCQIRTLLIFSAATTIITITTTRCSYQQLPKFPARNSLQFSGYSSVKNRAINVVVIANYSTIANILQLHTVSEIILHWRTQKETETNSTKATACKRSHMLSTESKAQKWAVECGNRQFGRRKWLEMRRGLVHF